MGTQPKRLGVKPQWIDSEKSLHPLHCHLVLPIEGDTTAIK